MSPRALARAPSADVGFASQDWSPPVNLGPLVNSTGSERNPAISRDGLSLYISSDRPGGSGSYDLWVSHRESRSAPWGAARNLGEPINSAAEDLAPTLSADGHYLYYHSGRPGGCGGFDLYVAYRTDTHDDFAWGPPMNLGCTINTPYNDAGPSLVEDEAGGGPSLYFTSTRPGGPGDFDIYRSVQQADGSWGPASLVLELSGPARDTRTAIRHDGLELFISSDAAGRVGGLGGQDIWVSTRQTPNDPWSRPVNLGPVVNSTAFDGGPALSYDGTELYFFSGRPHPDDPTRTDNDLYVTTRTRAP